MLRRRLYLQIYGTIIASLITVVVLTAVLWSTFARDRFDGDVFETIGKLAALSLPAANTPVPEQQAAVRRLSRELEIDIALFDRNRERIAASDPAIGLPDWLDDRSSGFGRPRGYAWTFRLPDGRWLVADLRRRGGRRPLLGLALLLASVAFGVGVVAYPFVRRLTRRIERLQAGVQRIGAGELSARVEVEGRDEVAQLAGSFNEAAEKIEKLVGAHRLLLANASHELRTPLSRVRLGVEMLETNPDPSRVATVREDIAELDELIDEILLMSRLDARNCADLSQPIDPLALVAEECARYQNCEATGSAPEIHGDIRLLHRMVRNLLENAVKYGRPPVIANVTADGDQAILTISDTGGGIPDGLHDKVFQPFYRVHGHQNVKGYGLGLPLVRQIAEAHGGSVSIVPKAEATSAIRVSLPLHRHAASNS
ncbi:MAG: HAMP domain-containing sensor histidine kinase [Pseudomonadota bacterium]